MSVQYYYVCRMAAFARGHSTGVRTIIILCCLWLRFDAAAGEIIRNFNVRDGKSCSKRGDRLRAFFSALTAPRTLQLVG